VRGAGSGWWDIAHAQGVMLWHAQCVMLAGPLLMINTARVS
jgi:hypothetical protein